MLVTGIALAAHDGQGQAKPAAPRGSASARPLRLYVMDCGTLRIADPSRFQLRKEELAELDLSVTCYLISHPRGTLMWDVGAVPDARWTPTGRRVTYRVVLPDSQTRDVTVVKTLKSQLGAVGVSPSDVTYLALSHYHYDHTANANAFAHATWLVRQGERDTMFARVPPGVTLPATYARLRDRKTQILRSDDHDVFGDGTVVIKSAPGHTPGHQLLYVKLAQTGGILLSGDLYHYPEERVLDRVPTFEFSPEQTRASRVATEEFLKRTGAQLWIQHDLRANARLRKAPAFYQ
ncbi:MAG: N-acyl homoserine lactonase family protein [Gemmatimonadaceae bacterium]